MFQIWNKRQRYIFVSKVIYVDLSSKSIKCVLYFFQLHIPWFISFDHSNFFNDHILFKDHNNRKLTKDLFPVFLI